MLFGVLYTWMFHVFSLLVIALTFNTRLYFYYNTIIYVCNCIFRFELNSRNNIPNRRILNSGNYI
jgi:hypothetical protein